MFLTAKESERTTADVCIATPDACSLREVVRKDLAHTASARDSLISPSVCIYKVFARASAAASSSKQVESICKVRDP